MEGTHWSFLAHVCLYPLYLVERVSESILYMRLESHLPSPPELSPNSLIDPFCCCKGPGRLLGTDPSRLSAQSQIWLLGLVFSAEWGLRILGDPAQILPNPSASDSSFNLLTRKVFFRPRTLDEMGLFFLFLNKSFS